MNQVRRRGQVVYEDLLREMEAIEHQLLAQDSGLAMSLMVLEAKVRERFQQMDRFSAQDARREDPFFAGGDILLDDVHDLIPKELGLFPEPDALERRQRRKKTFETVGMAAVLAMVTALGVFGLASILQIVLGWII